VRTKEKRMARHLCRAFLLPRGRRHVLPFGVKFDQRQKNRSLSAPEFFHFSSGVP